MEKIRLADAHIDTLTKFRNNPFDTPLSLDEITEQSYLDNKFANWNLSEFQNMGGVLQYFAIFTPPELTGNEAVAFAVRAIGDFIKFKPYNVNLLLNKSDFDINKINILLSIEGASPLVNDDSFLYAYHQLGIRAIGITWNHRNFLADGIDEPFGLTKYGREIIHKMEKLGVIVDVSHLNNQGFRDVCEIANKPFIASHSNAKSILNHPRNLEDWQIKEIIERGGFIGLNFYSEFISGSNKYGSNKLSLTDELNFFRKHIEHFLNLGAIDVLGFGGDFDGITRSPFRNVRDYEVIYNLLIEMKLNETEIQKLFADNLINYTLKMLN